MKHLLIVLSVSACATLGVVEATSHQQAQPKPAADPMKCVNAAGLSYSKNALVKVNSQLQSCGGSNRWIAMGADGTRTEALVLAAKGKKDCVGAHAEEYESGLFRQTEKQIERCDNGKWVAEKK